MVKAFYYGSITLAIIGLLASLLIFPSDNEIALLQYKDRLYSAARESFEEQIEQGDVSASVVVPLTDLYLQHGDLDLAISLLEMYAENNPKNIEALIKLGRYYQYDQRFKAYQNNLERLYQLAPSAKLLKTLSDIYNSHGEYDDQRRVLESLTSKYKADKQDYLDLAYLYANEKNYAAAVGSLNRFSKWYSEPDPEVIDLSISLLIDDNQTEKAFEIAKEASDMGTPDERLRYATVFHSRQQETFAYRLLKEDPKIMTASPEALYELTMLEISLNHKDRALERLKRLRQRNKFPDSLLAPYIALLIDRQDYAVVPSLLDSARISSFDPWLISRIIEIASNSGDYQTLQQVDSQLHPAVRGENPDIDIRLRIALGESDISERADKTRRITWISDDTRLRLAELYRDNNYIREARAILSDIETFSRIGGFDSYRVAELYTNLDRIKMGLNTIDSTYHDNPADDLKPKLILAEVLLATSNNDTKRVMRFLESDERMTPSVLVDIYYIAESKPNARIMLAASQALVNLDKEDDRYQGFYARALLEAGDVYQALPVLKALSGRNGKDWIYVYSDTLLQLGQLGEWRSLWMGQVFEDHWIEEERRSIGYALIDKNFIPEAISIFIYLSEFKGPADPDTTRLVDLWHQNSDPDGLIWLKSRLERSEKENKEAWFGLYYSLAFSLNQPASVDKLVVENPEFLIALINLDIGNGRTERAFTNLAIAFQQGRLSLAEELMLANMALDHNNQMLTESIFLGIAKKHHQENDLIALVKRLLNKSDLDISAAYKRQLAEAFGGRYPSVVYVLKIDAGDEIKEQELSEIRKLPIENKVLLAGMLFDSGRREFARALIDEVDDWSYLPEPDVARVSEMFLAFGAPEKGLELFTRKFPVQLDSINEMNGGLDRVKMLLAAATGKRSSVLAFLEQSDLTERSLTDLYYIAMDFGQGELMLITSETLYRLFPSSQSMAFRARALLYAKDYRGAFPFVETLYQSNPDEWDYEYASTLMELGENQKLINYWWTRLGKPGVADEQKREIAFNMLAVGFREDAEKVFLDLAIGKPFNSVAVRQLLFMWGAEPKPENIDWIHDRLVKAPDDEKAGWMSTLIELGRADLVAKYLKTSTVPDPRKREVAFTMLSKGFRAEAETVFMTLAQEKSPKNEAVQQLLFLWGARPRPQNIAWLSDRLAKAPVLEKSGWMRILVDVGQEDFVVQYVERNRDEIDSEGMDILLEALFARRDRVKFARFARDIIVYEDNLNRLLKIAKLSTWQDMGKLALAAYRRAYEQDSENRAVVNEYAKTAFYQGELKAAKGLFTRFFEMGGLDYQSSYFYAEILWQDRETRQAKIYYEKSFELMTFLFEKSISDFMMEAKIDLRLGKVDEGLEIYRKLINQHPENMDLKTVYAETLIELNRLDEAEKFLSDNSIN